MAADALWDGRQASGLESQVLAEVAEEVAANQAELQFNVEFITALLDRTDRFLRSRSAVLATLPEDSVQPMLEGLSRPQTFDPQTSAASLLSQTALLSADGIGVRARVSEFFARVSDADEEKEWFNQTSRDLQDHLATYAARAAEDGRGTVNEMAARLGASVLGELRMDEQLVRLVIQRGAAGEIYLRNLATLTALLESLSAQLGEK
ncbi:MAG TPA: hypothetical protein VMO26_27235 [Vicinamibacterales bacterium]|nr:hypothetical protein [Vicinamibacterales bacterium]